METMEMVSDEKAKPEKTTPKKVESATPKRKRNINLEAKKHVKEVAIVKSLK